jgi:hypothetical protein
MSVRGRRGEEEAQEEGDRQTEELQVFNSTFHLFAAAIASSRVFSFVRLFFLMIVRVFQLAVENRNALCCFMIAARGGSG